MFQANDHPRTGGLVGTVSRIGRRVAPVTSLVCTLVCLGQRCGVDSQAFQAQPHLTIILRRNKHDLIGFGIPALRAEHGPVYSH